MYRLTLSLMLTMLSTVAVADPAWQAQLSAAMDGPHRSDANKARDGYRHPAETLAFFGIEDGMTVMEIWPGGGWYTELLAPAMRDHGKLVIATWDPQVEGQPEYRYRLPERMQKTFEKYPAVYDQVEVEYYSPPASASLGEAGSVDAVLTFRNTHGWIGNGIAQAVFDEFERVLKPGGILGVVQHRAPDGPDPAVTAKDGYVSEAAIKELASRAGLVFEASSEVNANPKDSRNHPEGVWTLPPSLRLGDEQREKYEAIGESDRMTLRFRKPGA